MLRERRTSYWRHVHLVVHTVQERWRVPIYVLQPQAVPAASLAISDVTQRVVSRKPRQRKYFSLLHGIPIVVVVLCIITAIGLLSSLVNERDPVRRCPVYDCSSVSTGMFNTTDDVFSSAPPSQLSFNPTSGTPTSSSSIAVGRNLLYGDFCTDHIECSQTKQLFCQHEFDLGEKHCFCETSFYWNPNTQQCEPKKEMNSICAYDNECRLDMGLTCDLKSGTSIRRCRCMGEYYWSKISNCGDLKIEDFVHCITEQYISSCLLRQISSGSYHNVNIRQIENGEIDFDYFLVDSPELQAIERMECSWSRGKRYCFGINNDAKRLLIVMIDLHGIESFHHVNQSVIGLPNVLTQGDGKVVCYIEGNESTLLSITVDPATNDQISVHRRNGRTYGERSCFIVMNRTTYCFYRDLTRRLIAVAMDETVWNEDTQTTVHQNTNLKTGPSCGWIGGNRSLKFYCFAVFTDERIHRIEQRDDRWSDWMLMPSEKIFIQRPIFLTSREANDISMAQSCHVLAIDTSNEVYVSSNMNCPQQDSFSPWTILQTEIGLLSFNGSFRLRDGRVGVFGVGIDDLPYYTTMDPVSHLFEPIKLAVSMESFT